MTQPVNMNCDNHNPPLSFWGLVLARKYSRRLPGKAMRPLLGKPMIQYTFDAAMAAQSLAQTWLFTDQDTAFPFAHQSGVQVPEFERPVEVSNDDATTEETVRYFLSRFAPQTLPDYLVLLQATSPLRRADDIDGAVSVFLKNRDWASGLVSIAKPLKPMHWTYQLHPQTGALEPLFLPQDNLVLPNGAIYICDPQALLAGATLDSGKLLGYEMPWQRSVDIDTIEEFTWAEALLRQQRIGFSEAQQQRVSGYRHLTRSNDMQDNDTVEIRQSQR